MNYTILYKTKPWFQAGRRFGWKGAGLGIDRNVFERHDNFLFVIKDKKNTYTISKSEVRDIVLRHKSIYRVKDKQVYVVPFNSCKPYSGELKVGKLK